LKKIKKIELWFLGITESFELWKLQKSSGLKKLEQE
jgi:hypothetical protein